MIDTLELAKKLESAGFQRPQAEALASAVAGGTGERDKQLDELRESVQSVRDELRESIQGLKSDIGRIETLIAKSRTEQIMWTVGALGALAAFARPFQP